MLARSWSRFLPFKMAILFSFVRLSIPLTHGFPFWLCTLPAENSIIIIIFISYLLHVYELAVRDYGCWKGMTTRSRIKKNPCNPMVLQIALKIFIFHIIQSELYSFLKLFHLICYTVFHFSLFFLSLSLSFCFSSPEISFTLIPSISILSDIGIYVYMCNNKMCIYV